MSILHCHLSAQFGFAARRAASRAFPRPDKVSVPASRRFVSTSSETRPAGDDGVTEILFRSATEIRQQCAAFSARRQNAAILPTDKFSADEQLIRLLDRQPGLLSCHELRIA